MSNIFGNLDSFLENYDDNGLDNSIDGEALNGSLSAPSPVAVRKSKRKSKLIEAAAAAAAPEVPPIKEANAAVPFPTTIQQPTVVEVVPAEAVPPIAATVDLSTSTDLDDEMQELCRIHDFIFLHKNPVVEEQLRMEGGSVSEIKRSFRSLKTAYDRNKLVKDNEIGKLRTRLNKLKPKLNQLQNDIQGLLMDVNPDAATGTSSNRRRRSRRVVNPVPALQPQSDVITITLDADDPPGRMPMSTVPSATIDLDSDNEEPPLTAAQLSTSFEAENYQMRIKVKWGTSIVTFDHRRHQKFADIMAKLAARENAETDRILLNIGDRIIYPDDTPDTIDYKTFQFISGRILKEKAQTVAKKNGPAAAAAASQAGLITLKLQLEKRKAPLQIRIEKTQSMTVVIVKCAEELKCKPEKIRLFFDGDVVDGSSKPDDLELEGGEMLDVRLVD